MGKNYLVQYLLLVILVVLGTVFFHRFNGLPYLQMAVIVVTAAGYVGWGYLHHRWQGDLHPRIMIEYLLIAALAILLMRGAIIR